MIGNYSAQDFAPAAKSVRTCKLSQEGICPAPEARGRFRKYEAEGGIGKIVHFM